MNRNRVSVIRVDFHSLNMLLELLVQAGNYAEAVARVDFCRRLVQRSSGRGRREDGFVFASYGVAGGGRRSFVNDADFNAGGTRDIDGPNAAALFFPLEIMVKEGVCYAHLGDLRGAEACWQPLLTRRHAGLDFADMRYEVCMCYFALRKWEVRRTSALFTRRLSYGRSPHIPCPSRHAS